MRAFVIAAAVFLTAAALDAQQPAKDECLACHETVDAKTFDGSVHGPLECTSCHADVTTAPHGVPPQKVDCASCHPDTVAAWNNSLHAKARRAGIAPGATCADCHGGPHAILSKSDPASKTFHTAIPKTCAACHAQKFVMEKAGLSAQPAISYQESIHGRAAARGSARAAVCTDCHEAHDIRPANDPQSGVFKFNVARTCGRCHARIAGEYGESVHGRALARGNWDAPVCADCHGIHTIARVADPDRGPRSSCAHCHEGVRLSREFGVPTQRVQSFERSYHGLARRMGSVVAADCASCHGPHDTKPSSDPRSAIHPRNLQKTCGKCHLGVRANFVRGKVHLVEGDVSDTSSKIVTWVRRIYVPLIIVTIGFMLLHNMLIWWRKAWRARQMRGKTVLRMNLNQRIQHLLFASSFLVLVVSGFALAWPESVIAAAFGPSEELRRLVHRIAAVVMIALGVYHFGYMLFTKEGRQGLRDFRLRTADARDLLAVLRGRPHRAGRFNYAEKTEYWAALWGTIVMAATGVMIWYFVGVATWIPRWWIDVATAVHFYEAVLATLAIIVWHFYHVIFDPDVYPMNWAWYDGKMPEDLYRHEHPGAVDELSSERNPERKE
ncbi:MAG TPA: cytochrome c3 family protein [Thermoanaerobaculia bacterium]|nr:cytochrome c3 family protein [Thermoanaerobaculia bacterium]